MLCTITKMAVLGALGIERVIFLDRNDGLGQFYFYPYMVTCKMSDFDRNSSERP